MSLAGGRAPRKTAGNRLSGLLEAEEEDEFYQTTYGGFTEASGRGRERGASGTEGGKEGVPEFDPRRSACAPGLPEPRGTPECHRVRSPNESIVESINKA